MNRGYCPIRLHEDHTVEILTDSMHEWLTCKSALVPAPAPGPVIGSCSQMLEMWLAAVLK